MAAADDRRGARAAADPAAPPADAAPAFAGTRRAAGLQVGAWLAVYLAIAGALQFGFLRVAEDADTDYHLAVARLIRDHGVLHAFPWTPFSILAEHYADKELLFHLLFVPFAGLDPATAANLVGTICGAALLLALYLVLRRERVPGAGLWAMVPLLASSAFLYRFTLVRPHLLSIALAAVVLWAAARGRLVVLAIASALYPWAYVAWQLPVVLAVVVEGARVLSGRRPGWRVPAVALGAVAVGVALHPNGRELLRFNWIVLSDILVHAAWGARQGVELGDEFRPFTLAEWGKLLVPPLLMTLAALPLAWRRRRDDALPFAFALAAAGFCLLTLRTARFAEYFGPFAVLAFALAAAPAASARPAAASRAPRSWRWRPAALLAVTLLVCAAYSGKESSELLGRLSSREPRFAPPRSSTRCGRGSPWAPRSSPVSGGSPGRSCSPSPSDASWSPSTPCSLR